MRSPGDAMSSRGEWRVGLAGPEDGAQLAAVLASDDGFPGDIRVLFTRGANPYLSLRSEGEDLVVPVVRQAATDRIVGMGACVVRTAWVNGVPRRVGYLTGLKALPEFRGRVPLLAQVYRYLRQQTADVELYYTTILTANTRARRVLERPPSRGRRHLDLPEYRHVGTITTHLFRSRRPPAASGTLDELAELTARLAHDHDNLAVVVPRTAPDGARVRILRDDRGRATAGCVVWDQQQDKQYTVTRYEGRYARLSRLPVHWAGFPRWPVPGVPARSVSVNRLAADSPGSARRLLAAVAGEWRELDFVGVALVQGHRLAAGAPRRSVTYSSELYTVHFEPDSLALDGRDVTIDLGLL
jgi:hypothetical protein